MTNRQRAERVRKVARKAASHARFCEEHGFTVAAAIAQARAEQHEARAAELEAAPDETAA